VIAYVILAHRAPEQVVRLVRRLEHPDASFFIHVDRYADDAVHETIRDGIPAAQLLPRHGCTWGGFGIVRAALEGLRAVHADGRHDVALLLSGQDYPIRRIGEIHDFLYQRRERSFVNHFTVPTPNWTNGGMERMTGWHWHGRLLGRTIIFPNPRLGTRTWHRRFPGGFEPYGGSMYWGLSREAVAYVLDFVERETRFMRFFRHAGIPDESFFQTILLNSPLAGSVVDDDLHYADWSEGKSHPKTLGLQDLDAVIASGNLFARKFDDPRVLDAIDERVHA
jgi:hypothetical protein